MSSNLKVNTILPSAGSNIGLGTNGGNLNVDGGCKVQVGTALTLGHTVGVQFATQNLHSTGFEVNNVNASGIITASQFKGDGSQLTGISAGVSVANQADNRLITATGTTDALNAEANLTFASNVLTLSGTLNVSGEVQIAENIVHSGDGNTAIGFPANDTIRCITAGSERLRIDSSGRVLIGTTTEGEGTADDLTIATSGTTGITIRSGTSGEGNIFFSDGTSGAAEYAGTIQYSHNSDYMLFFVNAAERLRIDSSGKIGISRTATQHPLEIGHASEPTVSFWRGSTKSAALQAQSAGTYLMSYEDAPLFFSVASGSGYTERLRISSTGQLGVSHNLSGTSAYNRLMLHNPHDGSCWIQMTSTASGNAANTDGFSIGMNSSNVGHVWLRENAKMMFATNGTSRMEISAEGYISNSAQPMFGGHGFAGAGTQTQSNVPAFKFTTVYVNQGSHFNNSTGVFTCPVAGKYLLLASFAGRSDAFAWSGLYVLKNGATMSDNWFPPAINTTSVFAGSHFTYAPLFSGSVYNCAANDTLVMGYHSSYSAPNNSSRNSLFIMLVG